MAKITIKRINIFSIAKWHAVTGLISGLLIGAIYFGIAIYYYGKNASTYGYYYFIAFPLMYGVVTFFSFLIGSIIYNSLSGLFGGIKFEIESEEEGYSVPPPPPETWS